MGIQVRNLFYYYSKEKAALNDINLDIKEGTFTAIIGATGSGKSTFIQNLNALLVPSEGEVHVDEFLVTNIKKKNKKIHQLRKKVAIVFQFPEYQLFEETVLKDVAFGVKNFGAKQEEAEKKAKEALLSVGINENYFNKSPFELSGGERRRVAIAGILAIDPEILVLDEPTAGLDMQGSIDIMNLVSKMHQNGKTIILITHDMDIVMKYATNVIVINDGKVMYHGEPHSLFINITEDMGIDIPPLYRLAIALKNKGMDIDLSKIKNNDDLIVQIAKWRKR